MNYRFEFITLKIIISPIQKMLLQITEYYKSMPSNITWDFREQTNFSKLRSSYLLVTQVKWSPEIWLWTLVQSVGILE